MRFNLEKSKLNDLGGNNLKHILIYSMSKGHLGIINAERDLDETGQQIRYDFAIYTK